MLSFPSAMEKIKKTKKKILIIEDTEDLNEIFWIAFSAKNFEIQTCQNGVDGLKKFFEFQPDVVFLDVMMPQMDGYHVVSELQKSRPKPLIILASNLEQKKSLLEDWNGILYLKKSDYTPSEMVAKVEEFLKSTPPTPLI